MANATDALNFAHSILGKPYSISSCRCSLSCWALDCSGLICASVNAAGLSFPCTSSFGIADVVAHYGTQISENEAINTPGAIGIENPFGGANFNGSNGHIVFFDGNGQTTTEEMGHAYGCCHGRATGRGFSMWAHFPGLNYGPPPPPPPPPLPPKPIFHQENTMVIQTHHYPQGSVPGEEIPTKNPKGHYQVSYIVVSQDGNCLECHDNASLVGAADPTQVIKRLIPDNLNGAKIIAVEKWDPRDGTVPGVYSVFSDGRGHADRFV